MSTVVLSILSSIVVRGSAAGAVSTRSRIASYSFRAVPAIATIAVTTAIRVAMATVVAMSVMATVAAIVIITTIVLTRRTRLELFISFLNIINQILAEFPCLVNHAVVRSPGKKFRTCPVCQISAHT